MTPDDYKNHFQGRVSDYSMDGALNSEKWEASKVKVLFLLKETYGYQNCGIFHIKDEAHQWLKANIKTYRKMVPLAAAIKISLQQKSVLSKPEIHEIANDRESLGGHLDEMAVINIKKHSGESRSSDREIRDESLLNASFLKAQITELRPTVIIAGGNVCWKSLIDDIGLFTNTECTKFNAVVCKNTVLFRGNHPAAWAGRGFNIEEIHSEILSVYPPL